MSFRFDMKWMAATAAFALFLILTQAAPQQNGAADANANPAAAKPTPHLANGHADLNGIWNPWVGHVVRDDEQAKKGTSGKTLSDGSVVATYAYERRYNTGGGGGRGGRGGAASKPEYKPELAAKVKDLEDHQNRTDPSFKCLAPGVPRIGPPHEIIQSAKKVVFIYSDLAGNFWRIIPTDGTPHNADADPSYLGDSIGHWEGDTLVVDDVNFTSMTHGWASGIFSQRGGTCHRASNAPWRFSSL